MLQYYNIATAYMSIYDTKFVIDENDFKNVIYLLLHKMNINKLLLLKRLHWF